MSQLNEYKHDDFEVVRTDNRFGGFEELRLKDQNATVSSYYHYLLLLINETYRTYASSASPFPQISPLNWTTCMLFCYHDLLL